MLTSAPPSSATTDMLQQRAKGLLDEMLDVQSEYHHGQYIRPGETEAAEDVPLAAALEAARSQLTDAWRIARYATLRRGFPYLPEVSDSTPGASPVREILIRAHELIMARIATTDATGAQALAQEITPLVTTLTAWRGCPELAHLAVGLKLIAETLQTVAAGTAAIA